MAYFHKKGFTKILASIVFVLLFSLMSFVLLGSTLKKSENIKPYLTECKIALGADRVTEDVPILSEKVKASCKTLKLDNLNDLKTPNRKKAYIADRIAQAYWITWEGTDNLFDDDSKWHGSGYNCMVLFDLDYNNPKVRATIKKADLLNYMISTKYATKGITYNYYIQAEGKGSYYFEDDLEPGFNYAIAIINPKSNMWGGGTDDKNTVIVFGKLKDILTKKSEDGKVTSKCMYTSGVSK